MVKMQAHTLNDIAETFLFFCKERLLLKYSLAFFQVALGGIVSDLALNRIQRLHRNSGATPDSHCTSFTVDKGI